MCVHALSNLLNEFGNIYQNGVCFFATTFANIHDASTEFQQCIVWLMTLLPTDHESTRIDKIWDLWNFVNCFLIRDILRFSDDTD